VRARKKTLTDADEKSVDGRRGLMRFDADNG
jgi:hypothetical protein